MFCLLLFFAFANIAVASRVEHMVSAWQPINYDIALTLNEQLSEITKARVSITVQVLKDRLSVIDLDFGELPIDSVSRDGRSVKFTRTAGLLNIELPDATKIDDRFVFTVEYHGRPQDGLVLATDKDGKASATGDNWPNRAHHWIPCLDHPSAKATVKFTVTAPSKELVVANGKLENVTEANDATRTWTYSEGIPIPAYCMVITVGEYTRFESDSPASIPVSYYVPHSDAGFAMKGFTPAVPSLKFFSETIAPFPYEKLALIVGATRFGGMENSSAIVFASTLLDPRKNPRTSRAFNINEGLEQVIAHEIAHQWFGDSVTEATWADLWLSEGFATYFAGLFVQKFDGEEAFQAYMKRAAESYFDYEKNTRTPIHDTETENLMELLNGNNYQKGAWVLHMLRAELGDEAFFAGLRTYYEENRNSIANTKDLEKALEKAAHRDLNPFFRSWIFKAGHPQYDLSWKWLGNKKRLRLTLRQLQSEDVFPNRVPIELELGTEHKTITIEPATKLVVRELKLKRSPSSVRIDPNNTILKEAIVKPSS